MPTSTYTPLANITLGSSAASVTFSSISQAYRDLVLVVNAGSSTAETLRFQVNSDTGSNYSRVNMFGNGSTASSSTATSTYGFGGELSTTIVGNAVMSFMDYSATDKHKTILVRGNNAGVEVMARAIRWASTSAITSIVVSVNGAYNLIAGSTLALYGVAA